MKTKKQEAKAQAIKDIKDDLEKQGKEYIGMSVKFVFLNGESLLSVVISRYSNRRRGRRKQS